MRKDFGIDEPMNTEKELKQQIKKLLVDMHSPEVGHYGCSITDTEIEKMYEFISQAIQATREETRVKIEHELDVAMEQRDYAEECADLLSYKVAGLMYPEVEAELVIGEHSSANDPWQNAINLEENLIFEDSLKAQKKGIRR